MARKKREEGLPPSQMQNNPFRTLKGFSVLEPEKTPPVVANKSPERGSTSEEPVSFAEEMARLKVQRITPPNRLEAPEPVLPPKEPKPKAPCTETELFLAELGKLDRVFTDNYPEAEEPAGGAPRRMRRLRQGKLIPEATLDLHGLTRDEAREKVRFFLENSVYHGMQTVVLVTGWGRGSGGEPVLRGEIERYLAGEGKVWVVEWGRAPKAHGGEGALVAFLRSGAKASG